MKLFFDHNVPAPLRRKLHHPTVTAEELGWDRLSNGILLRTVEDHGHEVFLTCDQSILYQQNLSGRKIAIILLTRNQWPLVSRWLNNIVAAIEAATSGSFQVVDCTG